MNPLHVGTLIVLCGLTTPSSKTASDLSELERDALALELYLQDRSDHDIHCPFRTWEQPPISVYKETLESHLPEGCIKDENQ